MTERNREKPPVAEKPKTTAWDMPVQVRVKALRFSENVEYISPYSALRQDLIDGVEKGLFDTPIEWGDSVTENEIAELRRELLQQYTIDRAAELAAEAEDTPIHAYHNVTHSYQAMMRLLEMVEAMPTEMQDGMDANMLRPSKRAIELGLHALNYHDALHPGYVVPAGEDGRSNEQVSADVADAAAKDAGFTTAERVFIYSAIVGTSFWDTTVQPSTRLDFLVQMADMGDFAETGQLPTEAGQEYSHDVFRRRTEYDTQASNYEWMAHNLQVLQEAVDRWCALRSIHNEQQTESVPQPPLKVDFASFMASRDFFIEGITYEASYVAFNEQFMKAAPDWYGHKGLADKQKLTADILAGRVDESHPIMQLIHSSLERMQKQITKAMG